LATGLAIVLANLAADAHAQARARLTALPGLDARRGLAALRGNVEKYTFLLSQFAASHAGDMARVTGCLAAGDVQGAGQVAHALKGVAATLGALRLADRAGHLEAALRDQGKAESALIDAIASELAVFQDAVAALPGAPSPGAIDSTPVDPQRLARVLAELTPLLVASNTRAGQVVQTHASVLRAALGARSEILARQIGQFDFDAALDTLRPLLSAAAMAEMPEPEGTLGKVP